MHGVLVGTNKVDHRRAVRSSPLRYTKTQLHRGADEQGRFIGAGDIDRGYAFFRRSRGGMPVARDEANRGGREPALTSDQLRALWARRTESKSSLAVAFAVSVSTIYYHLRPSRALSRALATP